MKKIIALLIALSASLTAGCYNYNGDINFGVQGIYWQPIGCDFHWASKRFDFSVVDPESVAFDNLSVKARYDWGFRLFATYEQDCNYFDLSYAWHRASGTQCTMQGYNRVAVSGTNRMFIPFVNQSENRAAIAQVLLAYRYQNVDLQVGRVFHRRCCDEVKAFGNIRWVDLRQKQRIRFIDLSGEDLEDMRGGTVVQIADFEGIGLGTGVKGSYSLPCQIGLTGSINPMAIIGKQTIPTFDINLQTLQQRDISGSNCVIPAVNAQLGLTWNCCGRCYQIEVDLGWEVEYYWGALKAIPAAYNEQDNVTSECFDIGFSGPYFGGRILF